MSKQWKWGAMMALAGAIAGGAIALLTPARYVSSAVLQIPSAERRRLTTVQEQVLSRASLAAMIQQPGIDVYRRERERLPLEDVIQTMRMRDIKVEPAEMQDGSGLRVRISFEYPDRDVAPLVVRELVQQFQKRDGTIQAVEMPQGPGRSTDGRLATIGIGLGAGALLGPLILLLRRRSWQWHLLVFGFAIAGGLAAELAAFYGDFRYPDDLELGALGLCAGAAVGVFLLRRSARTMSKAEVAIAATAAGAVVAGLISFMLPEQYESKALMRFSPGSSDGTTAERISQFTQDALSRTRLAEWIQRPALDLYREERRRRPLDDVVKTMRTHLAIAPLASDVLEISYRYPDRFKAQAVVREVIVLFLEQNSSLERRAGGGPGVPGSLMLEVLDPAGLPERPVAPDRLLITGAGASAGLLAALLALFVRRQSRPRRFAMLRFALGAGTAGACVAAAIAFAIPSRYLSTAVVRIVQPESGPRDISIGEDLQMRIANVVSSNVLTEVIQRPSLNLYAGERSRRPIKEVIQQIRARDLRIETLKVSGNGRTESVRIGFEYPDRAKAHEMVRAIVSLLVEGTVAHPGAEIPAKSAEPSEARTAAVAAMRVAAVPKLSAPSPLESLTGTGRSSPERPLMTAAYVEVLDPPSIPDAPELPNRINIVSLGLLAGLLLGPVAALLRRDARPVAA